MMTTRRLFISFFLMYGILIPVLAQEFVAENTSASIAMIGSCIIIALLFWSKRVVFINIIIAFYVFQSYLTRPFVSIFEKELSAKHLAYIESNNSYFNPDAAEVVYWSLFSLLLAWLIGLLLLKSPRKGNISFAPKIFTRLDQVILKGGLPFFLAFGLLFVLNYQSPESGLRGGITGEGSGLFLWGLASLSIINIVCLYAFLKRQHAKIRPANYYLLVPPLISVLLGALSGSRGAVYHLIVLGLVYWLALNIHKRWKLYSLLKTFSLLMIVMPIAVLSALFAQMLRPLFRYTESIDATKILGALDYESVLLVKENLLFGITELLHRLSSLKAQFYILNDWYIHNPWQYYNPFTSLMGIINGLVPGDIFPGMLTINQLFDYIYHDTVLVYNSEMWSIQGTLYLYFGNILAPIVVFFIAIVTNRLYPLFERNLMASPAFAAFFVLLLFDIITNGTAERVIPVDIVRPITSFVIFLVLYKAFSLFLPSRISPSKRRIGQLSSFNADVHGR
jgi:hypothetical protein